MSGRPSIRAIPPMGIEGIPVPVMAMAIAQASTHGLVVGCALMEYIEEDRVWVLDFHCLDPMTGTVQIFRVGAGTFEGVTKNAERLRGAEDLQPTPADAPKEAN